MNQWIGEFGSRWSNDERMIRRINENQWINESVSQSFMNQWVSESMNQWFSESVNERMNKCMVGGWIGELLFFVGLLLHWAASSLRHLFSQPLLVWAATYLGHFCSERPPSYLFCSFCNPFLLFTQPAQCVLQHPAAIPHSTRVARWWKTTFRQAFTMRLSLPAAIPLSRSVAASLTHALLRAAVPMRFVASGRKPAEQGHRTKSTNVCAVSTVRTRPHKSSAAPTMSVYDFYVRLSSRYDLGQIFRPGLPNVLQSCILYRFFVTSSSHYSLVQYSPLIVHKCSETATCSNISNQAVATVLHGSVHFLSRTSWALEAWNVGMPPLASWNPKVWNPLFLKLLGIENMHPWDPGTLQPWNLAPCIGGVWMPGCLETRDPGTLEP